MKYFDFLLTYIDISAISKYTKLLSYLFDRPFQYEYTMDENRRDDGLSLRQSYLTRAVKPPPNLEYEEFIFWNETHPCSWLEAMIALSIRCENIMCKPGPDTTSRWFWGMIDSLYLSDQIDNNFQLETVEYTMQRLEIHEYRTDGFGGLFYVPNLDIVNYDMRKLDFWEQAMRYLEQFD